MRTKNYFKTSFLKPFFAFFVAFNVNFYCKATCIKKSFTENCPKCPSGGSSFDKVSVFRDIFGGRDKKFDTDDVVVPPVSYILRSSFCFFPAEHVSFY